MTGKGNRRRGIVDQQQTITEQTQARLLEGLDGKGWHTILRGAGGSEHTERLDFVPARDLRDTMSALNHSTTITTRLDDSAGDQDDARSLIAGLVTSLQREHEHRKRGEDQ